MLVLLSLICSISLSSQLNDKANEITFSRFTEEDNQKRTEIIASEDFKNKKAIAFEKLMIGGFKHSFYDTTFIDSLHMVLKDDFYENSKLLQGLAKDIGSYDFQQELSLIKVPVLLIYGSYDPLSGEVADSFKDKLANAKLVVIERSGHFPFIESKDAFLSAVNNFYQN